MKFTTIEKVQKLTKAFLLLSLLILATSTVFLVHTVYLWNKAKIVDRQMSDNALKMEELVNEMKKHLDQ